MLGAVGLSGKIIGISGERMTRSRSVGSGISEESDMVIAENTRFDLAERQRTDQPMNPPEC